MKYTADEVRREMLVLSRKSAMETSSRRAELMLEQLATMLEREQLPIPMILLCPMCGVQHIDAPETHHVDRAMAEIGMVVDYSASWDNPPHRSHLCHACGCIWRPADVPTTGVARIETRGKADTFDVSKARELVREQAKGARGEMRHVAEVADINASALCAVVDIRSPNVLVIGDRLYLHPAPRAAAPDELPEIQVCQTYMGEPVSPEMAAYHEGWNDCRAAMLSAAPSDKQLRCYGHAERDYGGEQGERHE